MRSGGCKIPNFTFWFSPGAASVLQGRSLAPAFSIDDCRPTVWLPTRISANADMEANAAQVAKIMQRIMTNLRIVVSLFCGGQVLSSMSHRCLSQAASSIRMYVSFGTSGVTMTDVREPALSPKGVAKKASRLARVVRFRVKSPPSP